MCREDIGQGHGMRGLLIKKKQNQKTILCLYIYHSHTESLSFYMLKIHVLITKSITVQKYTNKGILSEMYINLFFFSSHSLPYQ